jgi:hypothetical protein
MLQAYFNENMAEDAISDLLSLIARAGESLPGPPLLETVVQNGISALTEVFIPGE